MKQKIALAYYWYEVVLHEDPIEARNIWNSIIRQFKD